MDVCGDMQNILFAEGALGSRGVTNRQD